MPQVKVTFRECIQDSQEYGSNDEHMVSRVLVEIDVDGQRRGSFITDLKQTVGADFETGPIEVGVPIEVGSQGKGIRLAGGANIRMQGNRFVSPKAVEFTVSGRGSAW